jgi:putative glutamine amidotransferase
MSKSKKIIGIPCWSTGDGSFGCTKTYLEFISHFGTPRMLTPDEDIDSNIDMILLPGGLDANPNTYGEAPGFYTSNTDVFKNHFVQNKLQKYIEIGTSVVGICLGAQQLAVMFGSKLSQNFMFHEQSKGRWETAHDVYKFSSFRNGVLPKKLEGDNGFKVNSHHHQGVTLNNLGPELEPLLLAHNHDRFLTGDGPIVEAFMHKTLPIVGFQAHPEEMYDSYSRDIIKQLLGE